MFKTTFIAASLMAVLVSNNAHADVSRALGKALKITPKASTVKPPEGYASQWWTHPIGCEYSRAGRPDEIVWYLIINTAKRGCPAYIVTRGFSDAY